MQICVQRANTQLTVVDVNICNNNSACISLLHDPQVCTIITVSLSARLFVRLLAVGENAHNSWTTLGRQHYLTTGLRTCNNLFDERGFAVISPVSRGQLLKILITLEPYGIFGSNFAYLFINIVQSLVCQTVTRLRRTSVWPVVDI